MAAAREDSGPIQLIPPGLLGFLQVKNQGRNPQLLPNTLQPTMDLLTWLMEARAETTVATVDVAPAAIGFTPYTTPAAVVVPSEEYWYVHDYTIQNNTALIATSTVSFACAWRIVTGALFSQFGVGVPQPLLNGVAGGRGGFAFAEFPFFLPPGAEMGIRVIANEAAANITYQGNVRFTRLPI